MVVGGAFCLKEMSGIGRFLAVLFMVIALARYTNGEVKSGLLFLLVGALTVAFSTDVKQKSKSG